MKEFRNGDRVKIHTKTAGCYDGQIGTVFHKTTTIPSLVYKDGTGFIRYSAIFEGAYDIRFDHRVDIGGKCAGFVGYVLSEWIGKVGGMRYDLR